MKSANGPRLNILLLGNIGSGKSATVNMLFNIEADREFDEDPLFAIATSIQSENRYATEYPCNLKAFMNLTNESKPTNNEKNTWGVFFYNLETDELPLRLIDTPGFEDDDKDNEENVEEIVSCIKELEVIHAIIWVARYSRESIPRKKKMIIERFRDFLPKECKDNIYTIFTNIMDSGDENTEEENLFDYYKWTDPPAKQCFIFENVCLMAYEDFKKVLDSSSQNESEERVPENGSEDDSLEPEFLYEFFYEENKKSFAELISTLLTIKRPTPPSHQPSTEVDRKRLGPFLDRLADVLIRVDEIDGEIDDLRETLQQDNSDSGSKSQLESQNISQSQIKNLKQLLGNEERTMMKLKAEVDPLMLLIFYLDKMTQTTFYSSNPLTAFKCLTITEERLSAIRNKGAKIEEADLKLFRKLALICNILEQSVIAHQRTKKESDVELWRSFANVFSGLLTNYSTISDQSKKGICLLAINSLSDYLKMDEMEFRKLKPIFLQYLDIIFEVIASTKSHQIQQLEKQLSQLDQELKQLHQEAIKRQQPKQGPSQPRPPITDLSHYSQFKEESINESLLLSPKRTKMNQDPNKSNVSLKSIYSQKPERESLRLSHNRIHSLNKETIKPSMSGLQQRVQLNQSDVPCMPGFFDQVKTWFGFGSNENQDSNK